MDIHPGVNYPSCSTPTTCTVTQTLTASTARRKPRMTYKSPSGGDSYIIGPFSLTTVPQKCGSSSNIAQPITLKVSATPVRFHGSSAPMRRKKYPMGPPLPLYHPLGRLASSLPPLDPASVGLPTPIRSDDAVRRSSARARRPVAKLRDVEDESLAPTPTAIPVLDVEAKDKPSPRKRRAGGSKRKRKEVDDGDATYPAKRTRMPRGVANQNMAADEESPLESIMADVTPTPEPPSEVPEDRKLDRRSTRSRGSAKRRDSSASEAASSISAGAVGPTKEEEFMEVENISDHIVSQHPGDLRTDEKEEGELSEEGQPATTS
ncbi:hypothetical protein FPV67DRAFT_1486836 [Lyophyllum atratum]|nr:hypothetical protein FPV67DRAFT_1486836 [Lyophyllum atratum]